MSKTGHRRPACVDLLSDAYAYRQKNIVLLTGDVCGLLVRTHDDGRSTFASLEKTICGELQQKFCMVRMDVANGITCYTEEDEREMYALWCAFESGHMADKKKKNADDLQQLVAEHRHEPLVNLHFLRRITESVACALHANKGAEQERKKLPYPTVRPVCLVLQHAGALFPSGNFNQLSELDRQRLVFSMSWFSDPLFVDSPVLVVMVNTVKSEVNQKIVGLPNAAHIEIDLPSTEERGLFVRAYMHEHAGLTLDQSVERFCQNTAGMTLENIRDILESAVKTGESVTKATVVAEVNRLLQARLGDIIKFSSPEHSVRDVIGNQKACAILMDVFERCEHSDTAVSALLVSGPNGSGKTFILEACAKESGRVVVELGNIRGQYFGETDTFFEALRWNIANFGKILILVDEAHTAFGSVHDGHTHETERRLAGNVIKMMGNPIYLGKVLWGLMTSRPDELDPDVKSRAPIQIPIFDHEGKDRELFVSEMFRRKGVSVSAQELVVLLEQTSHYSARDYRNLVAEVLAKRKKKPDIALTEVLQGWHASKSITLQREFQTLLAVQHCSYPELLPAQYKENADSAIQQDIERFRNLLYR